MLTDDQLAVEFLAAYVELPLHNCNLRHGSAWHRVVERAKELIDPAEPTKDEKTAIQILLATHRQEVAELEERVDSLERELGAQTYNGNSISYIYDKMVAYGNQVAKLEQEIGKLRHTDVCIETDTPRPKTDQITTFYGINMIPHTNEDE